MNDLELTKFLAEGVMEWEYLAEYRDWINTVKVGIDMQCPVFTIVLGRVLVNYGHLKIASWNPLDDWNDCMMCVEKMVKDGYDFHAHWSPNQEDGLCQGMFKTPGDFRETELVMHEEWESQDLKRAICVAAAKTRGLIDT